MLEEIPEVLEAYLVSGDYDYYIRIAVRDTRDYERLLRERLYRIPGITAQQVELRSAPSQGKPDLPLATAPVAPSRRRTRRRHLRPPPQTREASARVRRGNDSAVPRPPLRLVCGRRCVGRR